MTHPDKAPFSYGQHLDYSAEIAAAEEYLAQNEVLKRQQQEFAGALQPFVEQRAADIEATTADGLNAAVLMATPESDRDWDHNDELAELKDLLPESVAKKAEYTAGYMRHFERTQAELEAERVKLQGRLSRAERLGATAGVSGIASDLKDIKKQLKSLDKTEAAVLGYERALIAEVAEAAHPDPADIDAFDFWGVQDEVSEPARAVAPRPAKKVAAAMKTADEASQDADKPAGPVAKAKTPQPQAAPEPKPAPSDSGDTPRPGGGTRIPDHLVRRAEEARAKAAAAAEERRQAQMDENSRLANTNDLDERPSRLPNADPMEPQDEAVVPRPDGASRRAALGIADPEEPQAAPGDSSDDSTPAVAPATELHHADPDRGEDHFEELSPTEEDLYGLFDELRAVQTADPRAIENDLLADRIARILVSPHNGLSPGVRDDFLGMLSEARAARFGSPPEVATPEPQPKDPYKGDKKIEELRELYEEQRAGEILDDDADEEQDPASSDQPNAGGDEVPEGAFDDGQDKGSDGEPAPTVIERPSRRALQASPEESQSQSALKRRGARLTRALKRVPQALGYQGGSSLVPARNQSARPAPVTASGPRRTPRPARTPEQPIETTAAPAGGEGVMERLYRRAQLRDDQEERDTIATPSAAAPERSAETQAGTAAEQGIDFSDVSPDQAFEDARELVRSMGAEILSRKGNPRAIREYYDQTFQQNRALIEGFIANGLLDAQAAQAAKEALRIFERDMGSALVEAEATDRLNRL